MLEPRETFPSKSIYRVLICRKTFPGKDRWTADLSTALRSGRDDKGEGGASRDSSCRTGAAFHRLGWARRPITSMSKNNFEERTAGPQISPLRCAPVEMTKGRGGLPGTVVAEQEPLSIALGGHAGP